MRKGKLLNILVAVFVWILIWEGLALFLGSDILLVSPDKVIVRIGELLVLPEFWQRIWVSFKHIFSGFIFGLFFGCVFAGLSHKFSAMRIFLSPAVAVLRAAPVASFIILLLVWVSSRILAVPICFIIVFPVVYTNILTGLNALNPKLSEMACVFNMSSGKKLRYVLAPQMMPFLKAAVGISAGLAWKSGIAAEVIGMSVGSIGEMLQQAKVYLMMKDLFAWTVIIVILSLFLEKTVLFLLKRIEEVLGREPLG